MLIPHNSPIEDRRLFEAVGELPIEIGPIASMGLRGRWSSKGPGPVALTGGEWVNGVVLGPERLAMPSGRLSALEWDWTDDKLGEWRGSCQVRLLLMDSALRATWTLDATSSTNSTIIVPSHFELSANCLVVFQLKAGDRIGKIYSPPYIKTAGVTMRYRY